MSHSVEGSAASAPVVSVTPVVLPDRGRGQDLQVRVSAPATGSDLPIIVFSHGFGWSMDGYAPLVDFWAAHGFVVVQPTHLDSRTLGVTPDDSRYPEIWRLRVADLRHVLDELDLIEAAVPGLRGRLDRSRVAAAGHSWGGQTASMLLGARVLDADGVPGEDMSDPRVKAGVLLATTGTGGADLSPFAAEHFPFMSPSFSDMTTPALVIAGDRDDSPLSVRGPDWFTDPYHLSPGPKSLLTLFGAEHSLGGIAGYTVTETTDESPERVALIRRLTWAYLRSTLYPTDTGWATASAEGLGRIESK
ncbi:chlorophyllase [Micromonospora halotolerans]|uniref:Chlorophyllase n=1 Tax=Micromonospora halotolerans TaxID=709879 RepID=A0ABY9ZUX9_9ACTN|nr:chlorophyllase [Micromonospora halotolerans]WNM39094.1 chlorophyllase [Micromonospora halotolerans]